MDIFRDTSRKKMIILVFAIILLQLAVSTYFMAFKKNGYYSDDMYSYGFANSPGIFTPLDLAESDEKKINSNKWLDSSLLHEYLTVSKDERFTFGRVAKTLEDDSHPPLFYFMLHAICSLAPDTFSKWFGFIINAIGFTILQVYLYRLSLYISKNRFMSVLIITFFGFTSACISMMCLLRMYMLGTGFTVAQTYYSMKYAFSPHDKGFKSKDLLMSCIFLYLGAMTVYESVMFAFLFTLFMCCILLFKKQFKKMFILGFSSLISVALMVLSFPTFIHQTTAPIAMQGSALYPYMLQLRTSIHVICNDLFALDTPIFPSMIPFYIGVGLIAIIIIYLLMRVLFRNDEWFKNLRKKAIVWFKNTLTKSRPYTLTLLPIVLSCVLLTLYLSKTLQIYYFGNLSIRYLFILTPFIAMSILLLIFKLIQSKYVCVAIALILTCFSLLFGDKSYLLTNFRTKEIASITKDSDVVIACSQSPEFMNHIMELYNSKSFLYTNTKSIVEHEPDDEILEKSSNSDSMLLLLDVLATSTNIVRTNVVDYTTGKQQVDFSEDNDVLHYFQSLNCFDDIQYLGRYYDFHIYKLK